MGLIYRNLECPKLQSLLRLTVLIQEVEDEGFGICDRPIRHVRYSEPFAWYRHRGISRVDGNRAQGSWESGKLNHAFVCVHKELIVNQFVVVDVLCFSG